MTARKATAENSAADKKTRQIEGEAIVQARLRGESEISIMSRLGCSAADLLDSLDGYARTKLHYRARPHALALDLGRLEELVEAHQPPAKAGDTQSCSRAEGGRIATHPAWPVGATSERH